MTSKSKATELVDKFYPYADSFYGDGCGGWDSGDEATGKVNATACARICVEEIIAGIRSVTSSEDYQLTTNERDTLQYYSEVLNHLNDKQ